MLQTGGYNPLADEVRTALITAIIDVMANDDNVNKIYGRILVVNPETNKRIFEGIPEDKINNLCVTLDVSPDAISMFNIDGGFIHTLVRFEGKATDLFIPVGSMINLTAISPTNETLYQEVLNPYINQMAPAEVVAPVKKKSHLSLVK